MSDLQLLTFGSAVSFVTLAGAYVFLRERWLASHRAERARVRRERDRQQRRRVHDSA